MPCTYIVLFYWAFLYCLKFFKIIDTGWLSDIPQPCELFTTYVSFAFYLSMDDKLGKLIFFFFLRLFNFVWSIFEFGSFEFCVVFVLHYIPYVICLHSFVGVSYFCCFSMYISFDMSEFFSFENDSYVFFITLLCKVV